MNPPVLIESDHSSLLLGWSQVPEAIGYELQMKVGDVISSDDNAVTDAAEDEEDKWVVLSSKLTGTEALKKNVDYSQSYCFRVRVKYSYGWDLLSVPSQKYSPCPPESRQLEPPTVVGRAAGSVTLAWPEIESATGYILRYRAASWSAGEWIVVTTVLSTNSAKKKGLEANEGYYFAVQPVEEGVEWEFSRSSQQCSPKEQPRHNAKCGYATEQGRKDWLAAHGVTRAKDMQAISDSYVADRDLKAPLYYWQLFSLLGLDRIHGLVTMFYKRVYADDEAPWFRDAFSRISGMDHHVTTQTQFWVDVMGGGRYYHGGDYRLNFHHTHNAATVMTARGAQRWMHHMRLAVQDNESNPSTSFAAIDTRILPCLKDFLRTKMLKYANEHDWKFDNSDFENFPV
jgi:truncated hemoglobin YjbI